MAIRGSLGLLCSHRCSFKTHEGPWRGHRRILRATNTYRVQHRSATSSAIPVSKCSVPLASEPSLPRALRWAMRMVGGSRAWTNARKRERSLGWRKCSASVCERDVSPNICLNPEVVRACTIQAYLPNQEPEPTDMARMNIAGGRRTCCKRAAQTRERRNICACAREARGGRTQRAARLRAVETDMQT